MDLGLRQTQGHRLPIAVREVLVDVLQAGPPWADLVLRLTLEQ